MTRETKTTLRGCIKKTKGPWVVHRTTKDGRAVTRYRFPTETERQKNKQRERRRRAVAQNIFAGLKQHGNYKLPKHAETNDLLKALCEEAGWHVEEDGTIYRKSVLLQESKAKMAGSMIQSSCQVIEADHQSKDEDYCTCNIPAESGTLSVGQSQSHEYHDINLMLSLSLPNSLTSHV